MSYLDEWHKQQKALKDKERQDKKGASGLLHAYHGGEHDIKHEKMLTEIKKKHMQRKMSATTKLQGYRGHGTPTRDQNRTLSSPRSKIDTMPEAISEDEPHEGGNSMVSVAAAIAAAEMQDKKEEKEEEATKMAARLEKTELETNETAENEEQHVDSTDEQEQVVDSTGDNDDGGAGDETPVEAEAEAEAEAEGEREAEGEAEAAAAEEEEQKDEWPGTRVELDFSFGLFYPKQEPAPAIPTCERAAADIVPNSIRQPKGKLISFNPEFPPVVKKIVLDEKFVPSESQQKLVRYIVKGKIPVFVKDKKEEAEEEDDVRSVQSKKSITVVGKDKKSQWKRVRKGKAYDWDKVPDKAQGDEEGEDACAPGLTEEKEESTSSSD